MTLGAIQTLRARLHFLKGNYRLILAWPIAAVVVCAIAWSAMFHQLRDNLRKAEADAHSRVTTQTRSYASDVLHSIEAIDQIALFVRQGWELSHDSFRLETLAESHRLPPTTIIFVAIFDREGRFLTSTFPPVTKAPAADSAFFAEQARSASDALYIGKPARGKYTDRNVIQFSRQLRDGANRFAGVVLVSVVPDYFAASFDTTTIGKFGFLGLIGDDGIPRATRIGNTILQPEQPALQTLPPVHSASGSALAQGAEWFADKRNRYIGWQRVPGYPLRVMVGLPQEWILQPYYTEYRAAVHYAIAATLALAAFTLIAMALSARLAWRKHQVQALQATYRVATEGGSEGFYIARPIFDMSGKATDFEVVDCNNRGAELLERRREELIGMRISQLYETGDPSRTIKGMREAMKKGFIEQEVQVSSNSPVRSKWIHIKIARPDGHLAITLRDITEIKAHVAELEKRGSEDALTGLPNRYWVNNYLPQAIVKALESSFRLAVLFIDLDGFKAVNDTMGHSAGDELLQAAARRLRVAVRPHDHVVRIGGDEFVVIIEKIDHQSDAAQVAERILHSFQESFRLTKGVCSIGTSIGISICPADGTDADTILKHADIAMYAVKTSGKRNYRFFDQSYYEEVRARHDRENALRQAVMHDQFVLHYQPRVDIATGRTSSMEALVRWTWPGHAQLEPVEFIPMAEETGLIVQLGDLIIDKVCAQLAEWHRSGLDPIPVSINVSPRQFSESNLVDTLSKSLSRHNVDPKLIQIELTEHSMMASGKKITKTLDEIQHMGIKLLVDDFGTGYSSLSQLQRLDFDVLKVDKTFTAELELTEEGNVFYSAIITMAHALGMKVVAEGVESPGQISILKRLRCDEIQGFYISRPLPPAEAQSFAAGMAFPSLA